MKKLFIEDTVKKIGQEVELYGWVDAKRDHKQIVFIDLRDRTGVVQVVGDERFKSLSLEDVLHIKGVVRERPKDLVNPKIKTGAIEVGTKEFTLLSKSKPLPIPVNTDGYDIEEEMRLKYRYLDLRRKRLTQHIMLRSRFLALVREYLYKENFIEIETPLLTKSTPEGSRDFLVPSRLQPGKFYALPQSPQQYKQLLMVAGFERYFQIAKALRDEDLRADRGFEHTQIDLEMSFVERKDVMELVEGMITHIFEMLGAKIKQKPFPIFTYQEAMKKFGADKFDLRTEEEKKKNIQAFAWVVDFPFFEKTQEGSWTFTHNPFSDPLPQYKKQLLEKKDIGHILTSQYDLVCNGEEVGGGSIRSHEPAVLQSVFEIMGYKIEDIKKQFGHMFEAFSYGAPPHGGMAPGVDRLMMVLTGETALREVVAFPMNAQGQTSVMDAPSEISEDQLKELDISLIGKKKGKSVFENIKNLLDESKIKYTVMEHEPVLTSEDAARVRKTPLKQGAKALVMYAEDKPAMVVVPADLKLDMKKFKQDYKIHDLRMATHDEVEKVTRVKVGAVPPFGNIFAIPLYVDTKLGENKEIVFNAGEHTRSIQMNYKDFEKVTKPIIGDFSK